MVWKSIKAFLCMHITSNNLVELSYDIAPSIDDRDRDRDQYRHDWEESVYGNNAHDPFMGILTVDVHRQ